MNKHAQCLAFISLLLPNIINALIHHVQSFARNRPFRESTARPNTSRPAFVEEYHYLLGDEQVEHPTTDIVVPRQLFANPGQRPPLYRSRRNWGLNNSQQNRQQEDALNNLHMPPASSLTFIVSSCVRHEDLESSLLNDIAQSDNMLATQARIKELPKGTDGTSLIDYEAHYKVKLAPKIETPVIVRFIYYGDPDTVSIVTPLMAAVLRGDKLLFNAVLNKRSSANGVIGKELCLANLLAQCGYEYPLAKILHERPDLVTKHLVYILLDGFFYDARYEHRLWYVRQADNSLLSRAHTTLRSFELPPNCVEMLAISLLELGLRDMPQITITPEVTQNMVGLIHQQAQPTFGELSDMMLNSNFKTRIEELISELQINDELVTEIPPLR